jgi:NAD(P)-dependent dehydrogenase (short-subunit alcohol dehydrogenase family)
MAQRLLQQAVLISGAAGTLGRAASLACAAEGATGILLDKNVKKLERLYDEILSAGGPTPALYPLDLEGATEADFAELAASIERELGGLLGLVHAAAASSLLGPILDLSAREVERMLRVNCSAPLQLTRALLPLLTRTGDASIIFISDSAAREAKAYWGAYGLSKIALEGLSRILAQETEATGRVKVHTFIPGPFKSPVYLKAFPGGDRDSLPEASHFGPALIELLAPRGRLLRCPVEEPSASQTSSHSTGQTHVR